MNLLQKFLENLPENGKIIELGTRKWGDKSTHHKHLWPKLDHIGVDILPGDDVDLVANAEVLSTHFTEGSIDAVFSASTFEHIARPWIAAQEILKVLKPGGVFFVQSHQTFPVHGYPFDYFRYTERAWPILFHGCKKIETAHEFPCKINPDGEHVWDETAPAFLNSICWGIK